MYKDEHQRAIEKGEKLAEELNRYQSYSCYLKLLEELESVDIIFKTTVLSAPQLAIISKYLDFSEPSPAICAGTDVHGDPYIYITIV